MNTAKTYFSAFALIVACAVIGYALWIIAGLTRVEVALTLSCLLLGAAQIISHLSRDRRFDRTVAQVDDLALASAQTVREMDSLKQNLIDLEASVEKAGDTRNDELTAQFQILETLVKQLAERLASTQASMAIGGLAQATETHNGAAVNGHQPQEGAIGEITDAQLLNMIRHSLEENRVDLYLQPIVVLPQRKTRFYEALTRLRDSGGEVIMPSSYLRIAETAGIMPMIDNLLLFRCVKVVRRLIERSRDIGVFCNISAHSLLDAEFFPHFLEFIKQNEELAGSLIFEFSQATINGAGPLEIESMAMLREIGFEFSMDNVTSLDFDYQILADRGFRYVKVDSHTLIDGMSGAGAQIHSADLKTLLGRYGIELIAGKIETERDVVTLLDYEVGLGQGYLFAEPRLVREEIIDSSRPQQARAM